MTPTNFPVQGHEEEINTLSFSYGRQLKDRVIAKCLFYFIYLFGMRFLSQSVARGTHICGQNNSCDFFRYAPVGIFFFQV